MALRRVLDGEGAAFEILELDAWTGIEANRVGDPTDQDDLIPVHALYGAAWCLPGRRDQAIVETRVALGELPGDGLAVETIAQFRGSAIALSAAVFRR